MVYDEFLILTFHHKKLVNVIKMQKLHRDMFTNKKYPEAKQFGIHWNIVKTESLTAHIYGPHVREETCTGSSVIATQLSA